MTPDNPQDSHAVVAAPLHLDLRLVQYQTPAEQRAVQYQGLVLSFLAAYVKIVPIVQPIEQTVSVVQVR